MNRLKVTVIGTGHLGRIHARLLQSVDGVDLVGVVDPVPESRNRVATDCSTTAFEHHEQLQDQIDAAIIATPTNCHFEIADQLLQRGVHLLIEKPVTTTVTEANHLIATARRHSCVLQVGHVERFNPAWNAVLPQLTSPRYIEAVRAGTYTFRSTDVSIVHDLMIHDLDLVLSLVQSPVVDVEALGVNVFGPHEDLAHARIKFANGCIVNLNASRVSYQPQRTMQIFGSHAFAAIDFAQGQAKLVTPSRDLFDGTIDLAACSAQQRQQIQETMFQELLRMETVDVEPVNAILQEQQEFVASIVHEEPVRVPGEHGRDALAVAEKILHSIRTHQWNGAGSGPVGPNIISTPTVARPTRAA